MQEEEKKIDRLTIGCIEVYALVQGDQAADGFIAIADAAVGDGDTIPECRAPQSFPRQQTVVDLTGLHRRLVFTDEARGSFKKALLADPGSCAPGSILRE